MTDETVNERMHDLERRIAALEARFAGGEAMQALRGKRQSAREFLMTKNAVSEPQKVLAFAYYLEASEGLEFFNVPDLDAAFRAAREVPPKNINDAVNKNVAKGLLMESREKKDSKKAWQLTATGERFVESQM